VSRGAIFPILGTEGEAEASALEQNLSQASELSKRHDWLGAVECYQRILTEEAESSPLRKSEIYEAIGHAFFQAAMQADTPTDFKAGCVEAARRYEKARGSYGELDSPLAVGRFLRCESTISYIQYWLSSSVAEKRRLIKLCWKLAKESLETFAQLGDGAEFGKTYNQLSATAGFSSVLENDQRARETIIRDATDFGERAIDLLSKSGDAWELSTAYVKTALFLGSLGQYFLDLGERRKCNKKLRVYWSKGSQLCEEAALTGLLGSVPDAPLQFWGIGTEKALEYLRKGLEYARKTSDKFLIGCALDWLAFNLYWKATACENQEEGSRLFEEALKTACEAKQQYTPISFTSSRGFSFPVELAHAIAKYNSSNLEVNVRKRHKLVVQAVRLARNALKMYERAGYKVARLTACHELAKALLSMARMEADHDRRKKLLEEVLALRTRTVEGFERFLPYHYFDQGFMIGFLANAKFELAKQTEVAENKQSLLNDAVADMEKSVELGFKYRSFYQKFGSIPLLMDVCRWQLELGNMLGQVYLLNKDKDCLQKQIKVLQDAAETLNRLDQPSRVAECLWKVAQTQDVLGEELKAAKNFDSAAGYYRKAFQKTHQMRDFCQERTSCMKAWGEVERAKHHHRLQEYGQSKKHFVNAAEIFRAIEQWRYLGYNYSALAAIDHAEDLSRKDYHGKAIRYFEQAVRLFKETKRSIRKELRHVEHEDERQVAVNLLRASDLRRRYCEARVFFENAMILNRKGDPHASTREFGLAAETFEIVAKGLESEDDLRDLEFVAALSRAWQKMMLAEEKDAPELYAEAALLFEKACEYNDCNKARFLALGHSRYCRALEAGTRFLDTQEMPAYSAAMQCLQSATRYYRMACLKDELEYAKATELLFEACVHVNNAKKEVDPEKKARLFGTAELILQASAGQFIKARRPEKKEQVLGMLKAIREEHKWTLSCTQVLKTPLVSATYFQAPTPTAESAVGLNRFEHADIQAYISGPKKAIVGEEIRFRLDLVNAAAEFGLLARIEDLIPSGLKFASSDSNLKIEDGSVDLKGRRLEPMKVESVTIKAKAIQPGAIIVSPKVIFVDDLGRFKTCKPRALRLAVAHAHSFEFKTKSAEGVFSFLMSSFVEDNEKKGMPVERCGWRSLGDVMKRGGISRSRIYKRGGGRGRVIAELEKLGVIETQLFSGERGRGGNVVKLRISFDREDVKEYMNQNRQATLEKSTVQDSRARYSPNVPSLA
jgi:tetratricopeptide (TPR) repeat protein